MTQPTPGEVADQIERTGSRVELEYLAGAHRALILRALRALDAEPSDAAVERAAEAIYRSMGAPHENDWAGEEPRIKECYRYSARAALAARDGAGEG